MSSTTGRFLRENAFLVAAVALPVLVVGFFLLATAIPRMRVPPPSYDLVLSAARHSGGAPAEITVEFVVRDGRVMANVRPVNPLTYPPQHGLLLFDHRTQEVRELPFDAPAVKQGDPPVTVPVTALEGRRVIAGAKAPDGYEFDSPASRSPGIVGEVFGMRRSDRRAALVKDGRIVTLPLPAGYEYSYAVTPVGWIQP